MNEADAARDFFSAYFHEDWHDEAARASAVVELFLRTAPPKLELLRIANGIRAFLTAHVGDSSQDLETALFREMGCYYLPSSDGESPSTWLERLAATLRENASK